MATWEVQTANTHFPSLRKLKTYIEIYARLRYYAVQIGDFLPTFGDDIFDPILVFLALDDGTIRCTRNCCKELDNLCTGRSPLYLSEKMKSFVSSTSPHKLLCIVMFRCRYALCYKSEGRWFDSTWYHWNFSLTKSFLSHYGPGFDSASNRNGYQEYFLGVKAAGA